MGHYALAGVHPPSSRVSSSRYLLLEATDDGTSRVMKSRATFPIVVNLTFPFPLRFKQVWHMARGAKSLYAWKALAPEGFVALGMVCTANGKCSIPVRPFARTIDLFLTFDLHCYRCGSRCFVSSLRSIGLVHP